MEKKRIKKNVLPKLKTHLLMGKSVTHDEAKAMWGTNRLAEYIRRLRHDHGMVIDCVTIYDDNGNVYGRYSLPKKKKVNRITSREYTRVGAG